MPRWKSDAYCAGYFKAFEKMPWPYKALDYGLVLMPLSMTIAAILEHSNWLLALMFWLDAVMFWLLFATQMVLRARGAAAFRRGVQPSDNPLSHQIQTYRWCTVVSVVIFFVVLLLELLRASTKEGWAGVAFLFAIVLLQASTYASNRFWPASAD